MVRYCCVALLRLAGLGRRGRLLLVLGHGGLLPWSILEESAVAAAGGRWGLLNSAGDDRERRSEGEKISPGRLMGLNIGRRPEVFTKACCVGMGRAGQALLPMGRGIRSRVAGRNPPPFSSPPPPPSHRSGRLELCFLVGAALLPFSLLPDQRGAETHTSGRASPLGVRKP